MVCCVMCEFEIFLNQPLHISIDLYKWRFEDDPFDRTVGTLPAILHLKKECQSNFEVSKIYKP